MCHSARGPLYRKVIVGLLAKTSSGLKHHNIDGNNMIQARDPKGIILMSSVDSEGVVNVILFRWVMVN